VTRIQAVVLSIAVGVGIGVAAAFRLAMCVANESLLSAGPICKIVGFPAINLARYISQKGWDRVGGIDVIPATLILGASFWCVVGFVVVWVLIHRVAITDGSEISSIEPRR